MHQLAAAAGVDTPSVFDHVLLGYLGFVAAACASWSANGCPPAQRTVVVDACVGALVGALTGAGRGHSG